MYSTYDFFDSFQNGELPPFVTRDKNGRERVLAPALARFIRENVYCLLVRDSGKYGLQTYVYEHGVYNLYDERMFKGLLCDVVGSYNDDLVRMKDINEAYQIITSYRNCITHDKLNAREDLINFKNGLLFVSAGGCFLTPHDPAVYSTIQIPCDWVDEPRETPIFDDYLDTLTDGNESVKTLLLQFMGVCFSNIKGYRMKKSLFMTGDGDTGKSQLKSLVERLLGKGNFIGIDLREIESRFGTGAIYGTRLAGSSDMSFMSVDELKTFKKLTGGDSLFAEFKGQQAFEYTFGGVLWFCMNRLPKFGGDDGEWVYDRIMIVNCPNAVPKDKQDRALCDKMLTEREGIIHQAVRALVQVFKNHYVFDEPASVVFARKKYIAKNNTVISFFNECMRRREGDKIRDNATTARIYRVYKAWCSENNNGYAKTAREFKETLASYLGEDVDGMTKKLDGNHYYKTYTLTLEAKNEFKKVYGYDTLNEIN